VRATSYRGEAWLKRLGADPDKPLAASSRVRCDALGCIVPAGRGHEVSLVRDGRALGEECASADALVSLVRVEGACAHPRAVIDPRDLRRGAAALRFDAKGAPHVMRAAAPGRPWQHGFVASEE
jgi:competence protein ComEC